MVLLVVLCFCGGVYRSVSSLCCVVVVFCSWWFLCFFSTALGCIFVLLLVFLLLLLRFSVVSFVICFLLFGACIFFPWVSCFIGVCAVALLCYFILVFL